MSEWVSESYPSCHGYQVCVVMREFVLICIVIMFWWIQTWVIQWRPWHGGHVASGFVLLLFCYFVIFFSFEEHTFCVYKLNLQLSNSKVCIIGVSGVPRNFFQGGFNKFSWGQRERGSGGGSPLVRGSGGSCNLVQEISFHIVKFSQFLVLQTVYDDNQFICHC